jgi:hypothetical protein
LYADTWSDVVKTYRARWALGLQVARDTGIDYWVPATTGYNSAAWGSPVAQVFEPTPAQFTLHLSEARRVAAANARYTKGRVITGAWNEFGEGSILEPMQPGMLHSGDEMLMAHAAACGRVFA